MWGSDAHDTLQSLIVLLIFSLKGLGHSDGPKHLVSPALGEAALSRIPVLPPLLLLTGLTNLQGLEAFLPSSFIVLTLKQNPKVGDLPAMRQLPKAAP